MKISGKKIKLPKELQNIFDHIIGRTIYEQSKLKAKRNQLQPLSLLAIGIAALKNAEKEVGLKGKNLELFSNYMSRKAMETQFKDY